MVTLFVSRYEVNEQARNKLIDSGIAHLLENNKVRKIK